MIGFSRALDHLLPFEGGYSNHPADSGGETYRGISRKNWPRWAGWNRIDQAKARAGFPGTLTVDAELQVLVSQFYRAEFWRPEFETLPSQEIANKVFDIAVNAGARVAVRLLQRACRAAVYGADVTDDGSWGPRTAEVVAQANHLCLLTALRSEQAGYYRSIIAGNQSQKVFERGWLGRAYS